KFNGTKGPINCLSFNHNGELLASGGDNETIRIWDIPTRKCRQIIEDHGKRWGQITCLVWLGGQSNEDLQPIAFGTGHGLTPMLELASTRAFEPSDPVEAIAFDSTQSRLVVSSHHGHITLYELGEHGTMIMLWRNTVNADKKVSITHAIKFYEDYEKILIFVLEAGEMICCDVESGKEDWQKLLKSGIGHASICSREKLLLVDNLSKGFDLYDLPQSSPSYTFAIPTKKRCIKVGVFAEDSSIVACGSDHGKIYIFSTALPIPLQIIRQAGHLTAIQALNTVTTTDTHFIASGSSAVSSEIIIWEKKVRRRRKLEIMTN
ncbi:WD40 repeat-like protein, partial [Phlegmacium glaucopus]